MLGNKCSTSLVSTPGRMFLFPGVYTRFAGVMFLPWLKVRVTATHALLSHVASQQKPPNYLDPASYQTFTTSNRCTQKCHRKPALLRGEQSEPRKMPPSLSREAREVSLSTHPLLVHTKVPQKTSTFDSKQFPSLHTPYWCTHKCHRKPALLTGEQSEP